MLGLVVEFDSWKANVSVSGQYAGQMTGLCGNDDGVEFNDWALADGTTVDESTPEESGKLIGDSYVVADDEDSADL